MTFSVNGTDIGHIVEVAATIGSIVATAIVCLIVYLMVRPPRHLRQRRDAPPPEMDAAEAEQLWQLIDRMEGRLAVLERALADQADRPRRIANEEQLDFAPAGHGRDSGRKE